jgi:hypothetical protein
MFPPARWLSSNAVPRSLARPGSSSHELCLSFRVRGYLSPARHHCRAPSLGSCLPFATFAHEVHSLPGFPHPTTFRPQRFSHSRRLPPSRTLRACFIPLPRPGFALQGLSPLPSRLTLSVSRTLMSLTEFSSQQVAPLVPNPPASPSGLRSEQRSVAANRWFRPANCSIPSCAFNSFGFFSGHLGDAFAPPPLMTFCAKPSLYAQRLAFSVSISTQPDDLSPDHLPVRGF